jgi:glycolate oxidase FAD binding subunit
MTGSFCPATEADFAAAVSDAAALGAKLSIRGGGSKAPVGRQVEVPVLDTGACSGVVDYDPPELVLTVRPGTLLADVEALVASERQMLAFEPFDHGPIFGQPAGAATIGGVIAAGVSGSRRLSAGGARDHVLGLRAVSGRGEVFVAGAKVVKNVTGYDLPKLAAGSWGRLFVMTEMTLKVLPRPETALTCVVAGLAPPDAVRAMALAMASQAEVNAAAHRPALRDEAPLTALRLEGFGPSVIARRDILRAALAEYGSLETLGEGAAAAFWEDLRTLAPLAGARPLWRVNLPPSAAPAFLRDLQDRDAAWLLDWAGGLVWLATDEPSAGMRAAAERSAGHAMLIRGDAAIRAATPAFHPPASELAALEQRVRRAFDPAGVFESGRF